MEYLTHPQEVVCNEIKLLLSTSHIFPQSHSQIHIALPLLLLFPEYFLAIKLPKRYSDKSLRNALPILALRLQPQPLSLCKLVASLTQ